MRTLRSLFSIVSLSFLGWLSATPVFASPPLAHVSELDAKLPSTDGSFESLSDYRGSVVLVHFFASWCGECLLEAPSLDQLYRALQDRGFMVVGVAIDDTIPAAQALKERLHLSFPVLVDTQQMLKKNFSVQGIPMSIVLNAVGSIASFNDPATGAPTRKIVGPRPWNSDAARASILNLLSSPASPHVALMRLPR